MSPAVQAAVEAALQSPIQTTLPLTGGQANQVLALTLEDNRRLVLRLHPRMDSFAGGAATLTRMQGLGLPVPQQLASGYTEAMSWQVLTWTPGIELRWALPRLSHSQQTRIAEQLIEFQRRVSPLPSGQGYGYVPPETPGTHTTWRELLGPPEAPDEIEAYLAQVPPTCFLDDITGKNVLIENRALSGIIDLDTVCYGDPLFWLALTQVGLLSDIGEAGAFYAAELRRLWGPDERDQRVLAYYSARIAADFLGWYSAQESAAWQERMQTAYFAWSDTANP